MGRVRNYRGIPRTPFHDTLGAFLCAGQTPRFRGVERIIEAGLRALREGHKDQTHGGYIWSFDAKGPCDAKKLAYGHVFVLLAAASALQAGFDEAYDIISDVCDTLDTYFWDGTVGRFRDEFNSDWTPFSTYRGMNANMHGAEALLAAYEATGESHYLDRAGQILDFFVGFIAPQYDWRIPEHYDEDWNVDLHYEGNPMFRPSGTTPGHSFEFARLRLSIGIKGAPRRDGGGRSAFSYSNGVKGCVASGGRLLLYTGC